MTQYNVVMNFRSRELEYVNLHCKSKINSIISAIKRNHKFVSVTLVEAD